MGYSAFRFIPGYVLDCSSSTKMTFKGTNDRYIIATKTKEDPATRQMLTHITVFCIDGRVLMSDQRIPGCHKFEGLEFL